MAAVPRTSIALLLLAALAAGTAQADESAVQRALIQRDQQSEAFSRQLRQSQEALRVPPGDTSRRRQLESRQLQERQEAENVDARQLREAGRPLAADPGVARELRSYERERMAGEQQLAPRAPTEQTEPSPAPLPLPRAARRGVDPVTPDRFPD